MKKNAIHGVTMTAMIFAPTLSAQSSNAMNPAISIVMQGYYAAYGQDPESYSLPGFMMGGESALPAEGFALGHSELVMSSNIDDRYFGRVTTAIADHEGETEVELEEAFVETIGLSNGLTVKAGRYFSEFGYLNNQHTHMWDFIDAPLVYRAMFGNQLIDDGAQLRWLAPSATYIQLGAEAGRGERFPAGDANGDGKGSYVLFAEFGGDISESQSWQAGLSYWTADVTGREAGSHDHGGSSETPVFSGDSSVKAFDVVWKWAPQGNMAQQNLKFQFEYLLGDERGEVELAGSDPLEISRYDGEQRGWYAQLVYQFFARWRAGLRYDHLTSDNRGSDSDVLAEAGLANPSDDPKRYSVMADYAHSEFSLIRLQYNRDESTANTDNQVYLQYTMSMGAHGVHQY